ncbi:hypothetical protein RA28_20990 [Ruegeria sp. ANG-S4]|uniref:hypothetical protein n=1 Tax=Ruegeria sp. ANG-S4 TaxID=1577904 RepID=UPI000580A2A5|nr:hypothetical protein [Ruegeria sp. ANG-S4]KIC41355.1 hypothetical protein RA28_20990 [Ruegeria sp. ANG-S4]
MAQINGINMEGVDGAALGGTAEEAAKVFLEAAGKGLAQVIADALGQAANASVGGGGDPAAWTELIGPCIVDIQFTVPKGTTPRSLNTIATSDSDALGGVSGSVSCGVNINF